MLIKVVFDFAFRVQSLLLEHLHWSRGHSRPSGHGDRQRSRSPQVCSHGRATPTATVMVKGLPKEATVEYIHQILAQWGPLRHVRVMVKKKSSVCRGIAFIDFPSTRAARKMMDEVGDCGLVVNERKLSFESRLSESEHPIVNAGVVESEQVTEEEHGEENDDVDDNEEDEDDCDYEDEVATERLPDPWTPEEVRMLKEAYHYLVKVGKRRPWKDMLEYGHNVFHDGRTNEDLRSKWKRLMKAGKWDNNEP